MRRPVVAGLTSAVFLFCAAHASEAATISANTTADTIATDGQCSLREAVISANTNNAGSSGCTKGDSGADTIMLAGTYELSLTDLEVNGPRPDFDDLDVTDDLTLKGDGAATTKIDAKGIDRVIETSPGKTLHVEGITITGGRLPTYDGDNPNVSPDGGGIRAEGPLFLIDSAIVDNRAASGDQFSVTSQTSGDMTGHIGPHGGNGGGVFVGDTLNVTGSLIADNTAGSGGTGTSVQPFPIMGGSTGGDEGTGGRGGFAGAGGGIHATGNTVISNSLLVRNHAGDGGRGGTGTGGKGSGGGAGGAGTGGAGADGGVGGALFVGGAQLDITGSSLRGNEGGRGGTGGAGTGGASGDTATAFGGRGIGGLGGHGGDAGALANSLSGTVTISDSAFSGNVAGSGGVGGVGTGGNAFASPRRGNADGGDGSSGGSGGALVVYGSATLANVTIDQNAAGAGGAGGNGTTNSEAHVATGGDGGQGGSAGGLAVFGSTFTLRYVTISANTLGAGASGGSGTNPGANPMLGGGTQPGSAGAAGAGGAIDRVAGTVTLTGSLLAYNQGPACDTSGQASTITGGDENLVFPADAACPGPTPPAPLLGALQDNGGPVQTRAPAAGGSAVDRTLSGCPAADARAVARPVGVSCDVGAYELSPPSATSGDASGVTANSATVASIVNAHGPAGSAHFDYGTTSAYGSSSAPVAVGTGFADTPVSVGLAGLPAGSTIHYRVVMVTPDGTAAGADRTFTTATDVQPDRTAPRISSLALSPKTFAVASKPTAVRRATVAAKRKAHKGTTIKFKLSEKANVVLKFARKTKGRKVKRGGKTVCGKPGRKSVPRRLRCTRYAGAGSLRRSLGPGAQKVAFSGRVGKRALKPGTYRLTVLATDAAKNKSRAARKSFRIVR
jgi:CSLREA domain-containing protein